jgi:hypothetical protein
MNGAEIFFVSLLLRCHLNEGCDDMDALPLRLAKNKDSGPIMMLATGYCQTGWGCRAGKTVDQLAKVKGWDERNEDTE